MIGQTIAHYAITAKIGQGGMGEVYLARDIRLGRRVALKVPKDGVAADDAGQASLLREAKTAAALNPPNVCTIYDVGEEAGQPYIAIEYVEGRTLKEAIPKNGLPVETAVRYGAQIAAAIAHAP